MVWWKGLTLKTLACDVDGVLTDGRYYCGPNGVMCKAFHCNDSVAVRLAKKAGLDVVFVTSASQMSTAVSRERARELGVTLLQADFGQKVEVLDSFGSMVYLGDCVDDIEVLERAALTFVPAGTLECVAKHATYVLNRRGGEGCLLEVLEKLGLLG